MQQNQRKEEIKKKQKNRKGVVYLSKIPPYMNVNSLRRYFKAYQVERIYLAPESEKKRKQRANSGGNRKRRYQEGWIQFADKRDAKSVARLFNGNQVGGKKQHNPSRDDIWCIRYLSKFTWQHLNERTHSDQRVRAAKLKSELTLVKKESAFYLEQVDLARKIDKMQEKKEKEKDKDQIQQEKFKNHNRERRIFTQRKPILKQEL